MIKDRLSTQKHNFLFLFIFWLSKTMGPKVKLNIQIRTTYSQTLKHTDLVLLEVPHIQYFQRALAMVLGTHNQVHRVHLEFHDSLE